MSLSCAATGRSQVSDILLVGSNYQWTITITPGWVGWEDFFTFLFSDVKHSCLAVLEFRIIQLLEWEGLPPLPPRLSHCQVTTRFILTIAHSADTKLNPQIL